MYHKTEIKILSDYISKYYKINKLKIDTKFYQNCYALWSAKEILELLSRTKGPAIDILNEYRDQMDDFACKKKGETTMIFSVAYDVATDLIYQLL